MILRLRCGYIGGAAIFCAILLRILWGGGAFLEDPAVSRVITYFYTGKQVVSAPTEPLPSVTVPQETPPPQEEKEDPLQISLQAGLSIEYRNQTGYDIDLEALLKAPLNWDLKGDGPTVLILHSHATESYKNTGQYTESDPYRTTDTGHNMVAVGEKLAHLLEARGIRVLHDRSLYDYPAYSAAYGNARARLQTLLKENPGICLVLDLHRDAVESNAGAQLPLTGTVNGVPMAQLELVVGTSAGGQSHPHWQKNAALAVKLQTVLTEMCPQLCRPMFFRTGRYNQDLLPGMLLVEVGAAGNTQKEALAAVEILAEAIEKIAKGTEIIN